MDSALAKLTRMAGGDVNAPVAHVFDRQLITNVDNVPV
jgi:hypothetical protein